MRLIELERALNRLRRELEELTQKINAEPTNTSLTIRRVNLMGRIVMAQSEVDRLRKGFSQL